MSLEYDKTLIPLARMLRKEMTGQEKHLWYDFLAKYPMRFQRQKTINRYIVDFYCHKARLVVEIDGGQHYTDEAQEYDNERTNVLNAYGLTVIRFSDHDIDNNFFGICEEIDLCVRRKFEV